MHRARLRSAGFLALSAAIGGCGGASKPASVGPSKPASVAPSQTVPSGTQAPPVIVGTPPASAVAVIRDWSSALARGDVAAAATYFATPSLIAIDPAEPAVELRTEAEIRSANMALPCGAKLLSSRSEDGYIDSLFRLGDRPGGDCGSGVGLTARVAFVIKSGQIVEWRRIGDEPGDSAHDGPGVQAPPAAAPSGPGLSAI